MPFMIAILLFLSILSGSAESQVQASAPTEDLDALLFHLSRQREVFSSMQEMSAILADIRDHLPVLREVLKHSDDKGLSSLPGLLERLDRLSERSSLNMRISRAERLLQLTETLEQMQQADPRTLRLLLETSGAASLTELIGLERKDFELKQSPPTHDIRLLLARAANPYSEAGVVLELNGRLIVLSSGERKTTSTGFVELQSVRAIHAGFEVLLSTEKGDRRMVYQ